MEVVSSVAGTITVLGVVNGNVSVVGGNLRVAGKVTGNASVVGGTLDTAPGGQVLGNSSSVGSSLNFDFMRGTVIGNGNSMRIAADLSARSGSHRSCSSGEAPC